MKVEVIKRYSVQDVRLNPDKIFVFGDNLVQKGKGGQAIIRDEPNAFGIPTKRYPHLRHDAFFADREDDEVAMTQALRTLYLLSKHHVLVFPADGLGTGLAKMAEKSPELFRKLRDILKSHFDLEVCEKGSLKPRAK